jgi:predicted enzyme related to lactoylglutathione lyase
MMPPRIQNITFACGEPGKLAKFWREALGYEHLEVPPEVQEQVDKGIAAGELDPTGWAMLVPPDGHGPRVLFQRRPKTPTESIPIHLDLNSEDPEAEAERLVELGATLVERKSSRIGDIEERCIVMRDPEGNGFCVQ